MKDFWVYFEFFGKKQKIKINASSASEAKQLLINRLTVVKVDPVDMDPIEKEFKKMFDFINGL